MSWPAVRNNGKTKHGGTFPKKKRSDARFDGVKKGNANLGFGYGCRVKHSGRRSVLESTVPGGVKKETTNKVYELSGKHVISSKDPSDTKNK